MMRNAKWFVAAALVMSTAGCVESMDSSYAAPSYGSGYDNGYYSNGYYAQSNGYYAQPTYYTPPVVYSQTRYVPVPVPVPQHRPIVDDRRDVRHDEPRQPTVSRPAHHRRHTTTRRQRRTPPRRRRTTRRRRASTTMAIATTPAAITTAIAGAKGKEKGLPGISGSPLSRS